MNKSRVESLSDGIIAIIITVMIFNLKPPSTSEKDEILIIIPQIFSYFESFFIIGIFWYKHNKLLFSFNSINRSAVWANHLFLFFLSLIPLVTSWSTQSSDDVWPRFFYGVVLLACFLSFFFMQNLIGLLNKKVSLIIIVVNIISLVAALYGPWLAYIFFGILGLVFLSSDEVRSSRLTEDGDESRLIKSRKN